MDTCEKVGRAGTEAVSIGYSLAFQEALTRFADAQALLNYTTEADPACASYEEGVNEDARHLCDVVDRWCARRVSLRGGKEGTR